MELKGKVALVLGAIKGIGKGIGLALAREGVKVVLNYYDWEESLGQMKQDFEKRRNEMYSAYSMLKILKFSFCF